MSLRQLTFTRESTEKSQLEKNVAQAKALIPKPENIIRLKISSDNNRIEVKYGGELPNVYEDYEKTIISAVESLGYKHEETEWV